MANVCGARGGYGDAADPDGTAGFLVLGGGGLLAGYGRGAVSIYKGFSEIQDESQLRLFRAHCSAGDVVDPAGMRPGEAGWICGWRKCRGTFLVVDWRGMAGYGGIRIVSGASLVSRGQEKVLLTQSITSFDMSYLGLTKLVYYDDKGLFSKVEVIVEPLPRHNLFHAQPRLSISQRRKVDEPIHE